MTPLHEARMIDSLTPAQQTLLEKARKHAVASFTIKSLRDLFAIIPGWTITSRRAYLPTSFYSAVEGVPGIQDALIAAGADPHTFRGLDAGTSNEPWRVGESTRESAERTRAALLAVAVPREALASTGPKGPSIRAPKFVVTDVSEVTDDESRTDSWNRYGVRFVVHANVGVVDIVAPNGWSYLVVTDRAIGYGDTLRTIPMWIAAAAEHTDLLERVNALLGTEPYIPPAQRVRDDFNVATCPACFGRFKLHGAGDDERLVLHGYERPGDGYVLGRCFGVGLKPYELSVEGTVAFREYIAVQLDRARQRVANWRDGAITKWTDHLGHHGPSGTTYTPEHPKWRRIRDAQQHEAERDERALTATDEFLGARIEVWAAAPQKIKRAPAP